MIVFGDRLREVCPRAEARALLARLDEGEAEALLLEAGALEAGVADALAPEAGDGAPSLRALMAATDALARLRREGGRGRARGEAGEALRRALAGPLPPRAAIKEPEGFAFYALDPALHAAAAARMLRAHRPRDVAVLGLRSIGTTLGAVVAAEAEAAGARARRLSVRPEGEPWDRRVRLSPAQGAALRGAEQVLCVDEGPGISGSSLAAAAEAAEAAGARLVHLLPAHAPDPGALRSERARALWARLPVWAEAWDAAVRPDLEARWGPLRDLGGGLWRAIAPARRGGPVHPWHERRKLWARAPDGGAVLLRWAGLGARGERTAARAGRLAERGGARPLWLGRGFLALEWVEGRACERLSDGLLAAMAGHAAGLRGEGTGTGGAERLLAILEATAAAEGLVLPAWVGQAAGRAGEAVRCDGRMGPPEWLRRPDGGFVKCDALDHADDHFAPGPQAPLWDLAGAAAEWEMGPAARGRLVEHWQAQSGGRPDREELAFHEAAWRAWRLGYADLAARTLPEPGAWRAEAARHRGGLRRALARGAAGWG
ncbi:hypothetical protein [Rubellimicrobium sp. CFH 75288]|uniref:hypothetical protein n=1 Tax=Rubellimicrobium sp. CFH 75288 TaxID=2697034 RepID=UPI00141285D2|nr:hypothetical protein [Rubellimicrobium sp. CFH 75288]NAZ37554.1 hypothetical protein [Rubellimicrobium sp. CFH 75288]